MITTSDEEVFIEIRVRQAFAQQLEKCQEYLPGAPFHWFIHNIRQKVLRERLPRLCPALQHLAAQEPDLRQIIRRSARAELAHLAWLQSMSGLAEDSYYFVGTIDPASLPQPDEPE